MADGWIEQFRERMTEKVQAVAEIIGPEIVEDIRDAIDTPVVRDLSGFHVVQRSDPGENPWLDTGNLWAEMQYEVYRASSAVYLDVFNTAVYARRLNDGHGNVAPRPFMDLARERWAPVVGERMQELLVSNG